MNGNLTADEAEKKYIVAMGPSLGRYYLFLTNECAFLHLEWGEFKVLFDTNPEQISLMNQSAGWFFFHLQNSILDRTLLQIARLMDPPNSGTNKENVTLLGLSKLVDSKIRDKIEDLLKTAQEKCAFSIDWRKRRIAHNDQALALNENAKLLETANGLRVDGALEAIAAVLNAVEFHYFKGTRAYERTVKPLGGAGALLDLLREGLDARMARRQRLLPGEPLPEDVAQKRPL